MARASIGGNGGSALRVAPLAGLGFVAAAVALLALYTLAHLHADEDMGGLKAELFQLRRDLAIVREDVRALKGEARTPSDRSPARAPAAAAPSALAAGGRGQEPSSAAAVPPTVRAPSPRADPRVTAAGAVADARDTRTEDDEVVRDCYIFTLWDYPKGAPAFATTNLEAWDRHARGLCSGGIVLLNDSNIPRWIPDMPKEYYRLEYRAAQSDAVRYSAIFHNGGMYIDADFIVTQDLGDIITRVSTYDLISYTTGGQQCKPAGTFSSNFMAGKKGSLLHKAVWDAQKAALTNHCQPSEMKLEKVCCLDDPGVLCHIPWTQLGEGISHRVLGDLFKKKSNREGLKVFCFGGDESLAPADIETVLSKKPMLDEALAHFESKNIRNPLGRIAYHLYSSSATMSGGSMKSLKRAQLFDERLFLGKLYSLSFQNSGPGPMSQQLFDAEGPSAGDLSGRALQALKVAVPPAECGVGTGLGSARPWACAGVVAAARKNGAELELSHGSATVALLPSQLASRGPRGTVVRIDAGGREWEALDQLSDADLQRVDVLSLTAYLCDGLPAGADLLAAAQRRVATLERLSRLLAVVDATGPSGEPLRGRPGSQLCGAGGRGRSREPFPAAVGVSYVSPRALASWRAREFEYADRLENATRPSLGLDDCDGFDSGASDGAGALYVWCRSVLERALRARSEEGLLAISYGVATWDKWSRRLSDAHSVKTVLYDCYATAANSGETPSLEGYAVPFERRDVCISGSAAERDGRRFETISSHLAPRGPRGTLVKVDVEGDEWDALRVLSDEDLRKIDLLDVQFYICKPPFDVDVWRERVRTVERLAAFFAVAARTPEQAAEFRGRRDEAFCRDFPTFSVSYASRERVREVFAGD